MLLDIKTESAQRITEIREYLDFIVPLFPNPPYSPPRHLNTSKGLVFVQLYGVIEYTINSTVAKTISLINSEAISILDLKCKLWGLALNAELDSLNQANKKKWDKRNELFQKISDNTSTIISDLIMPTNGENFTIKQLSSIWNTFHIQDPIFHDPSFNGRLSEIVTKRIHIAHGNNAASEIGSAVTPNELYIRISEVSNYCSYFIDVFDNYLSSKTYLK